MIKTNWKTGIKNNKYYFILLCLFSILFLIALMLNIRLYENKYNLEINIVFSTVQIILCILNITYIISKNGKK
jgi:uncharacterized membrane protein